MLRSSKMLVNNVDNCVDEMLTAIVITNPGLKRLSGHRIILRDDIEQYREDHVTVVSGGGSGHEPFAAGFVGAGMLSAAVCGSVFASPPSDEVLAALEAVQSPRKGTLLLVANYTGDRLNFGIGAERARARGHQVRVVVVGEDCALQSAADETAGRRGLVGIVVAMKLAGALAEEGRSLDEIGDLVARATSPQQMATIGLSLSGCSIPGASASFHLGENEMELGLGAHGEAGVRRLKVTGADAAVDLMLEHMRASGFAPDEGDRVMLTINNLGAMSVLEMAVLTRRLVEVLRGKKWAVDVVRVVQGHLMTSLDMAGFNFNIMKVTDDCLRLIDASTNAPGWPRPSISNTSGPQLNDSNLYHGKTNLYETRRDNDGNSENKEDNDAVLKCVETACQAIIAHQSELDELDRGCGDGDCGSTLSRGARSVLDSIDKLQGLPLCQLLTELARCAEQSMGGASGGIYSLFFTSACAETGGAPMIRRGVASVSECGGARLGDRTMLDALAPAAQAISDAAAHLSLADRARRAWEAAARGADETRKMRARAGRASYVSHHLVDDRMDAGARAVAIIFEAIYRSLSS